MPCSFKMITYSVIDPTLTFTANPIIYPKDIFHQCTIVNDTDQDIIVAFKTIDGTDNEVSVPKSIKAFSIGLPLDEPFLNSSIKIKSLVADADGKVTFNFAT